jgi:hypothetical protein
VRHPLALLLCVALLPAAAADAAGRSAFQGHELSHSEPTPVPVEVVLGCDLVLTTGGGTATVAMPFLPPWLAAAPQSVTVEPADCVPGVAGNVTRAVTLQVTPASDAPGLVPANISATIQYTGSLRGASQANVSLPEVVVAYRPGHALVPAGDQEFRVPGNRSFSFDLEIQVTANARTMVMFEDKAVSDPEAMLVGLKAETYDVNAGHRGERRKVTFTPPEGPWEEVTVGFRTFSHCLDGERCGNQMEQNVTWRFVNDAPAADPPAKGASAPAALAALGALAGALALRRRGEGPPSQADG